MDVKAFSKYIYLVKGLSRDIKNNSALIEVLCPAILPSQRLLEKLGNVKKRLETQEISNIISSIPIAQTSSQALLEFSVNHWQIENKLHRTRDTTFREDICNILCHKSQQINAALRNLAIFLLSKVHSSITSAITSFTHNISLAIPLLFRRI